jgi:hypothetical protein
MATSITKINYNDVHEGYWSFFVGVVLFGFICENILSSIIIISYFFINIVEFLFDLHFSWENK